MKYISLKSPGIFLFYFIFFQYEFLIKLKLWDSSLENADVKRYFKSDLSFDNLSAICQV